MVLANLSQHNASECPATVVKLIAIQACRRGFEQNMNGVNSASLVVDASKPLPGLRIFSTILSNFALEFGTPLRKMLTCNLQPSIWTIQ